MHEYPAYKYCNCLVGFSDIDSAISAVDELNQRIIIHNYRVVVVFSTKKFLGDKRRPVRSSGNDSDNSRRNAHHRPDQSAYSGGNKEGREQ